MTSSSLNGKLLSPVGLVKTIRHRGKNTTLPFVLLSERFVGNQWWIYHKEKVCVPLCSPSGERTVLRSQFPCVLQNNHQTLFLWPCPCTCHVFILKGGRLRINNLNGMQADKTNHALLWRKVSAAPQQLKGREDIVTVARPLNVTLCLNRGKLTLCWSQGLVTPCGRSSLRLITYGFRSISWACCVNYYTFQMIVFTFS